MKRSIPKSLVSKALEQSAGASDLPADLDTKSMTGPLKGAGSAWKAGALAQSQAAVEEARQKLADDVFQGRHELSLDPAQIEDQIGSDRREDWKAQEAFQSLVASIRADGQDTPIVVMPKDPDWRPDPYAPTAVEGVPFLLLTGRRRHAAAKELGLSVRAVLASPDMRSAEHLTFEMLFARFRENEKREDLGAFERLLSVGEMYDTLTAGGEKITAVAFAKRIGVHESVVSRARVVFARRDDILNAFKNAYDLSFGDLQKAIASLEAPSKPKPKKPAKLTAKRKIGNRNLMLTHSNGKLSVSASGVPVDQAKLDALSDLIADFFNEETTGQGPKLRRL